MCTSGGRMGKVQLAINSKREAPSVFLRPFAARHSLSFSLVFSLASLYLSLSVSRGLPLSPRRIRMVAPLAGTASVARPFRINLYRWPFFCIFLPRRRGGCSKIQASASLKQPLFSLSSLHTSFAPSGLYFIEFFFDTGTIN